LTSSPGTIRMLTPCKGRRVDGCMGKKLLIGLEITKV
jgi:hypothetical protein